MFKFKCVGNFDNAKKIYRKYTVDSDTGIKKYTITTDDNDKDIGASSLADTVYYLYDVCDDPNSTIDDRKILFRGKNEVDFPEIKDAKSCLTTNDGLVIFNYDVNNYKFAIVYDLTESAEDSFDNIENDPGNMMDILRYFKYTSPRVHRLEFDSNGKIQPKIIFKSVESETTKIHFFVDIDLDGIDRDEYGYYVCDNNVPDINEIAYIPRKNKTLVATEEIFKGGVMTSIGYGMCDYYFCNIEKMIADSNTEHKLFIKDKISTTVQEVFLCY